MHLEAYEGFGRMLAASGFPRSDQTISPRGLDVGGANVNGSVRDQLPNVYWTGLDIGEAPGVEIIADAAEWRRDEEADPGYDIVIATELFEHAERWREIIMTMALALREDGPETFISTCASTGRNPHGARGEWGVPAGQFYGNVDPDDLRAVLGTWFKEVHVEFNPNPGDAYAWAKGVIR